MAQLTILDQGSAEVAGEVTAGRALIASSDLGAAVGWELKPEGLCRDDVCVPVADPEALSADGRLDLAAVAAQLGQTAVIDSELGAIALSSPTSNRNGVKVGQTVPELDLADVDGDVVALSSFRGRKTLLVAFASW